MRVLILGCGRVGRYLASYFAEKGDDVTVVDRDASTFSGIPRDANIRTLQGLGTDVDTLRSAGVEAADAVLAVMDSDDANFMAALAAKDIFQVPRVVAGVRNPHRERLFDAFGIASVSPLTLGAKRIIEVISQQ